MSTRAIALALLTLVVACSREDNNNNNDNNNRKQETGNRKQETGHGESDSRSQRDLAKEIGRAEKMRREDAEGAYGKIRKSWRGKRVTWKVDVMPALCRTADACHALAFDRLGADRAVVQGWMPRLRLDAATFATLDARCRGRARCPVTIQATVADFTLSADEPTSLTLGDVEIGGT